MVCISKNCITGKFISEEKNRFLCTVEINGKRESCYIASSCRLDNFINLYGKTVLLKPNTSKKSSTRYTVYAVKHRKGFILLNTSFANKAIENTMYSRKLATFGKRVGVKKEYTIEGYKSDFYIPNSKTVIEVKSVISLQNEALFPTVYSERTLKQLNAIDSLLQKGYAARLVIVSLNPYVKKLKLIENTEFYDILSQCVSHGLAIDVFSCKLMEDATVQIYKKLSWE